MQDTRAGRLDPIVTLNQPNIEDNALVLRVFYDYKVVVLVVNYVYDVAEYRYRTQLMWMTDDGYNKKKMYPSARHDGQLHPSLDLYSIPSNAN